MRQTNHKIIITIIAFFAMVLISTTSKANGLILRNLDYQVDLNADGTANVVETWKIRIEDTNTLFKTFEIDSSKYKEIRDVTVQEVKSTGNVNFTKINQEKYHVDKNCFYALINKKGQFEIAWGAHAEDTTRTYKIAYTIVDAVKNYADCSEFYWQFISTDSEIPANHVTGTILLPQPVSNKEELKVWAHGPLNGNITIVSNDTVSFEVEDLEENTMLEARVVTPANIFANNRNISSESKLQSILVQEQEWANEANRKREQMQKRQEAIQRTIIMGLIVFNVIGAVLAVIIIKKIIKYHKELKEHPILKPQMEMEYYRDIPDENETPAGAGFLYYFKNTGLSYHMSKILSATMLDLCLKGYLSFEPVEGKKDQIRVILKEKQLGLPEDERIIYDLLKQVAKKETNSFTMKEFQKYASNHSSSVLNKINKIEKQIKISQEEKGNYSAKQIRTYENWMAKGVGYLFLSIFSLFAMQIVILPSMIATIYCFRIGGRYNQLTKKRSRGKSKMDRVKKIHVRFLTYETKRSTRINFMGKIPSICYCFWY